MKANLQVVDGAQTRVLSLCISCFAAAAIRRFEIPTLNVGHAKSQNCWSLKRSTKKQVPLVGAWLRRTCDSLSSRLCVMHTLQSWWLNTAKSRKNCQRHAPKQTGASQVTIAAAKYLWMCLLFCDIGCKAACIIQSHNISGNHGYSHNSYTAASS